jgi:hypothetical protein
MKQRLLYITVALFLFFALAGVAEAHALHARTSVHEQQIKVEVFFDNGAKAPRAKVVVKNKDGEEIARGETDRQGVYLFPLPSPGAYSIRADGGAGHITTLRLTVRDAGDVEAKSAGSEHQDHAPVVEDDQPDYEEATSFPWAKVGIGLGAIGLLSLALLIAVRNRQSREQKTPGHG